MENVRSVMGRFEREMSLVKTGMAVGLASLAISDYDSYSHAAGVRNCKESFNTPAEIKDCKDGLPDHNNLPLAILGIAGFAMGVYGGLGAAVEYRKS